VTRQPAAGKTVTVRVAPQVTKTSRGGTTFFAVQLEVAAGANTSRDPSQPLLLVFDASNWNVPQRVTVRAVDDTTVDGGDTREFPSRFVVADIAGPLTITGGLSGTSTLGLHGGLRLPGEAATAPPASPTDDTPTFHVDESDQPAALRVFNNASGADDVGPLTSPRLSGLGMGPDTVIGNKPLPGGITYQDLEAVEINLG